MKRRNPPRIGVVLSTELDFGRDILRGLSTFITSSARWQLELISPLERFVPVVRDLKPDGLILGPVNDVREASAAARLMRGRLVRVAANYHERGPATAGAVALVGADDHRVGRLAAQHFLAKGYRNYAFLGTSGWWSDARGDGYRQELARAGLACAVLAQGGPTPRGQRGWALPHYGEDVRAWLANLPKPVAILACNDLRGRELCELCRSYDVRVPDDVAILGVDNDDLECVLSFPPLSSVAIPWRRIGFESARAMAMALRNGFRRPRRPRLMLVPAHQVVERQSTDAVAITDSDVSAAIRFIREHAHEPIAVEHLLRAVPVARRSLEKRFQQTLSRSPAQEIRRAHVERAKRLLGETVLPLSGIADRSGFTSFAWFSKTFHDVTGETPSAYRRRFACR